MASIRSSTPDSSSFSRASLDERSDSTPSSSSRTLTPLLGPDVDSEAQFEGKGTVSSRHPDPGSSSNPTEDNHAPKVRLPVLVTDDPSDPVSRSRSNLTVSQNNTLDLVLSSNESQTPARKTPSQTIGSSQTPGPNTEPHTPKPSTRPQTPFGQRPSATKEEWEWQKANGQAGKAEAAIEELMELVGLEEVKEQILAIKAKIEICKWQGVDMEGERFNVVFQGNPGTGEVDQSD
jgi:hypothetical protein